jgi:FkbM family methyltransferase
MKIIINLVNKFLNMFNAQLIKKSFFDQLINRQEFMLLLTQIENKQRSNFIDNLLLSKSQLRQDLFVLSELEFKKNGYFVDFGATNGCDISNSYLLETKFNWKGILAEPSKRWHSELKKNRKVNINTDCLWSETGKELIFNEVDDGELSTIDEFSSRDQHKNRRLNGKQYKVNTISLKDLLIKYDAPKLIDYLSIDTEGSEFEILKNFDFDNFKFRVITCEHNYNDNREKIYKLLTDNGYIRKFVNISKFEDWYVYEKKLISNI